MIAPLKHTPAGASVDESTTPGRVGLAASQRASLFDALRARLRDTRGYMLAEQLVSVIFIGLLCVVVSAGIGAAMSAYANITMKTRADTMLTQAVELVSDELTYARDVEDDGGTWPDNPLYFTSATYHATAALQTHANGIWLNAAPAGQACLSAAQNGLTPELESLEYHEEATANAPANSWTFHITISSGDTVLAETPMTVKRIGS